MASSFHKNSIRTRIIASRFGIIEYRNNKTTATFWRTSLGTSKTTAKKLKTASENNIIKFQIVILAVITPHRKRDQQYIGKKLHCEACNCLFFTRSLLCDKEFFSKKVKMHMYLYFIEATLDSQPFKS